MKLTIHRNDLKAAVLTSAVAVNNKSPLPILSHLLLRAEDDTLRVSATDLEIAIERDVPAQVLEPGGCTVPAHLLTALVSQLVDDDVTLHLEGPRLTVKTRGSKYRFNALSYDEFPIIHQAPDEVDVQMDVQTFHGMLAHIKSCVAHPDETRVSLTGIFVELDSKKLSATSSDGTRLAHVERARSSEVRGVKASSTIVTSGGMSALAKLFADATGELSVSFGVGLVWFTLDGLTLMARTIDGKFPDYRALVPKSTARTVYVHRATLASALKRALVAAQRDSKTEKVQPNLFKLEFETDTLRVTSNDPDVGDGEETVPIRLDGTPIKMAFNGRKLLDAVASAGSEELRILLNDPLSMTVLKPVDSDDLFYLVMPVRVKEAA